VKHGIQSRLAGGRSAQDDGSEHGRQKTQLGTLCAQFDKVEIACRADDGVNLLQRGFQNRARHDGEGRLPHHPIRHGIVHQHTAGVAEQEGCGIEIAQRAKPGVLANLGRVAEQGSDHNVEQVEHVVLRGSLQRPHEGEQRRRAPLQRHPSYGLRLGNGRESRERHDPARRHVIDSWQAQGQNPHLVKPGDGPGKLGAAA
jgi:hypothetical protein